MTGNISLRWSWITCFELVGVRSIQKTVLKMKALDIEKQ